MAGGWGVTPEEAITLLRQTPTAAELLTEAVEAGGLTDDEIDAATEAKRAALSGLHGLSAALEWAAEDDGEPDTVEAPVVRPVSNPIPFRQRRER